ncbi:MAG: ATP-binding protein [Candidatus Hatepunaea meridiana]|nr:ATP-binding protein [Candidatus Hatepunaea meridiana]
MNQNQTESKSDALISGVSPMRYRRLWRFSIIITLSVSLIPLMILAIVNYHQDQKAFHAENRYTVSQILTNTKRNLESVIKERRSALTLIVSEQSFDELCSEARLTSTLRNLKKSFGGFVDLGLINSQGNQLNYVGPYNLEGKNYKDQEWFHEVCLRGVYVSDVFMGYRNFPHFVIAVKNEKEGVADFVLRATLDMQLLNQEIHSLNLDRYSDAFLINRNNVLQTPSLHYGNVLDTADIEVPPQVRNREVIEESTESGERITFGYAHINEAPVIVIATKRLQNPFRYWLSHRSSLLWFLVISVILIVIFVFYRATWMVNRLRTSDMKRAKALHNIEYTSKMATIGRMAASVAHEINNPLAIINEKAGLLKDIAGFAPDFPIKDKTLNLADSILNSVDRCKKVTHRLLGFGRRMETRKELIDLEHLMKEVVGFLGKEAEHRNIEVQYNIPKDVPTVENDRGQLQQIFLNLVNNAFAAVPDWGKIEISIEEYNDNTIAVTVKDNGSGISKDNLKHIFEPFYSTKGEFGTGLGLSITHDLVSKLGGKIAVDSKLGEGTSFSITLPFEKTDILG